MEKVRLHLVAFAGLCMTSPFVSALLRLFAEEPGFTLLMAIAGDLQDVTTHPDLVLPGIRLTGALNLLALAGEEKALADVVPPRQMEFSDTTRAAVLDVMQRRQEKLRLLTRSPPQTNEVARSSVLYAGICHIGSARPVRLLELGSSAGFNLLCDCYAFPKYPNSSASEVVIDFDWQGSVPDTSAWRAPVAMSRKGCDLNPLDLTTEEEFLRGLSYVWPDQLRRVAAFKAAAASHCQRRDVRVEQESAEVFLEKELSGAPVATVVMHSIFYQYAPANVRKQIATVIREAGQRATPDAPLHWLRFELEQILTPEVQSERYILDCVTYTGETEEGTRVLLAEAHPHGCWIKWLRF